MVEIKTPMLPSNKPLIVGKIDVRVGDHVEQGQVICQIETAKGNHQIKATEAGTIAEILVEEGREVVANDVLMVIDEQGKIQPEQQSESNKEILTTVPTDTVQHHLEKDLLVIGAGPGGYVAAIYASKRGMDVAIAERKKLGGTCLNIGCIPTKSMVQSAHLFELLNEMDLFGIEGDFHASINMEKVLQRKDEVVDTLVSGIEYLLNKNKVTVLQGTAHFLSDTEVQVGSTIIKAKNIIIATGSVAASLRVEGCDLPGVIDSTAALDLHKVPDSLVVIGGGVIGLEFAFIYNTFGSKVHVVEFQKSLLPMLDADAGKFIEGICKEKHIQTSTSSKVISIKQTVEGEYIVAYEKDGTTSYTIADKVLMSTGRRANTNGLGLEHTSIKTNKRTGEILVDEYEQTNVPHIYAIGDVSSKVKLAHLASQQGCVAVDHMLVEKHPISDTNVPSVVYTNPEIATVGYTEQALKEQGIPYKVSRFDFSANGRALTMNQTEGFVKLLASEDGTLLGAVICGPDASSLIAGVTVAMTNGVTVEQLTQTIFAHPTTSEAIREAALALIGRGIHQ